MTLTMTLTLTLTLALPDLDLSQAIRDFPSGRTFLFLDFDTIFAPRMALHTYLEQLTAHGTSRGLQASPVVLSMTPDGWLAGECKAAPHPHPAPVTLTLTLR